MRDNLPVSLPSGELWFCVRSKRFTEKIIASTLRSELGLEVFCPYIRYERARRNGKVWVSEAMFPNYLFARMDYAEMFRRVLAIRGVLKFVSFGGAPSPVPQSVIGELKESVSEEETIVLNHPIEPGEEVEVVVGPFQGVRALVTRVMPAKERVAILLDLLGGPQEVEISSANVLPETSLLLGRRVSMAKTAPPPPSPQSPAKTPRP